MTPPTMTAPRAEGELGLATQCSTVSVRFAELLDALRWKRGQRCIL